MSNRGDDRRVVSISAAAIYSGAAFVGTVEACSLAERRFRAARRRRARPVGADDHSRARRSALVLAALGPLGAAMMGVAVATTSGYADAAVLYMWPAVWTAFFYGTWGTACIVGWIGAVHGAVLLSLPADQSNIDRWVDVVVAVLVVAVVVQSLAARNERLVAGSRTRRASTRSPGC